MGTYEGCQFPQDNRSSLKINDWLQAALGKTDKDSPFRIPRVEKKWTPYPP